MLRFRTVWELPVPANALVSQRLPERNNRSGYDLTLDYDHDGDICTTTITFHACVAYRCTYRPALAADLVEACLGRVIAIEESPWLASLPGASGLGAGGTLIHAAISLEHDGCCHEFLCRAATWTNPTTPRFGAHAPVPHPRPHALDGIDLLHTWASTMIDGASLHLPRAIRVTGACDQMLGTQRLYAQAELSFAPAPRFEIGIAPTIQPRMVELGIASAVIHGAMDILFTALPYPVSRTRLTIEALHADHEDPPRLGFRISGRKAAQAAVAESFASIGGS